MVLDCSGWERKCSDCSGLWSMVCQQDAPGSLWLCSLNLSYEKSPIRQIVGARESLNGRERTGFRLSLFMPMVLRGWRSVSFTYIMRFLEGKKTAILLNETLPTFFYLFKPFIYLFVFFYSLFPLSQFWFCSPWRLLLTFSFLQPLLRPWHHVLFSEVSWQKSCKLQSIFCPRRRSIYYQSLLTVLIAFKICLRL